MSGRSGKRARSPTTLSPQSKRSRDESDDESHSSKSPDSEQQRELPPPEPSTRKRPSTHDMLPPKSKQSRDESHSRKSPGGEQQGELPPPELITSEGKIELATHLKKSGLENTAFWLTEFEKQGVTTLEALEQLNRDNSVFVILRNKAQYQVEKNALRKLLKIDELEHEEEQKLQERKSLKAQEEVTSKEKKQHIERVQIGESDARKHLAIGPESWTTSNNVLMELLKGHKTDHETSGPVQKRERLNDSKLLQNCSGGLALQGIFLSQKLEDQLEEKLQLLEIPGDVTISGAAQAEDTTEQFSSIHEEHEYKKKVSILGVGVAASASAPVYGGITIGGGVSASHRKEDEEEREQHGKKTYSSTVKHSELQVASYSFKKKDLKLSDDAKNSLKEISLLYQIGGRNTDSGNVYEACRRFFQTYGSHANLGPLTFGGRFWWTCSSEGFNRKTREIVKGMQSYAISTSSGITFAGVGVSTKIDYDNVKGKYEGHSLEDTIASTKLEVKTTGGPPEATDIAQWRSGLVANNSTWILIDRGKKLNSVWDIIKTNHEEEFGHLREVLSSSWERMTGLTAQQDLLGLTTSELTLAKVSKWNEEKQPTPRQIQDRIEYLLEVKREILDKIANSSFWVSEYLAHPTLQEFFLSVMNYSPSEHIKLVMNQLVEEEELGQLNTLNFPAIEEFSEWLSKPSQQPNLSCELQDEIIDFTSFNDFLKQALVDALRPGSQVSNEALAQSVEKGIRHLRVHYEKTYDDVLINILLYPYRSRNVGNVIRLKPLSRVNLELLIERFSAQRENFKGHEGNMLHLQSYLLLLAMDQYYVTEMTQFQNWMRQISQMMKELEPPLEEELSQQLHRHLHSPNSSLTDFKQSLLSLIESPYQKYPKQFSVPANEDNSQSLEIALQTVIHQPEIFHDSQSFFKDNSDARALLEKLGLSKYYPKLLTLQDSLCITPEPLKLSLSGSHPTHQQLPFLVLHKLMSYDSKCRSDLYQSSTSDKKESDEKCVDSDDEYVDSDDDYVDSEEDAKPQTNSGINTVYGIHPVDCLLALFLCSDDFLLQDLFSRLAKCQLAVPFILQNPFTSQLTLPLWAICPIIKDWKSTKGNKIVDQTHSIVSYPMPIVSFIRIGKNPETRGASKSKILNDVISDSHYDFFFHRHCPGGKYSRILGEGLVDMCWYLPAGKPADSFPDAITFLNLHGDARDHPDQCRFLSQISSMCFVLLTEENLEFDSQTINSLEKFNSSPGGLTILNDVEQKPRSLKKQFSESTVTNLIDKTGSEIRDVIRKRINKQHLGDLRTIEDWCVGERSILVDKEGKLYKEGLKCANKLKSIILEHDSEDVSVKEAMLPLQGETLWKAWAANDKEQHRHNEIGKEDENEYDAYIGTVKASIRTEQVKHIKALTPLTESLIRSLLSLGGSSNSSLRNYFLQCLKLELNSLSRKSIAELQHQYQSKRSLLQAGSDSKKTVKLKKELKVLQDSIVNSSCGLEHLVRELGQVYEAALVSKEYGDTPSRLPKAVAELLIDGHPLELMDGDAAHVPLQWVTAVLKEAVELLGDPKVFVLSVLGLQSTGKSTMLNTVFGVQFNVSAGRCTRGAYMQLLPLGEEIRKKTKCSYILIVDTEGLRAPELDPEKTHKHDNELATFVIGLANTTLINIYGEVPGDMDDILQTAVHAFLRMTRIKYHPSCQFVHQNASDNVKGEVGRAKFAEKLNKFTCDAAREEHCEGQCESFSDVIKFNDQTDVHYFPGLWKGGPPMAPVDEEYSDAAQSLKQRVVEIICSGTCKEVLSLSSFQVKMSDLWNSLLKEKFVFSFKNSLEIVAYNSLETAHSKWEWTFREAMLKWEQEAENEILPKPPPPAVEVSKLVAQKLDDLQACVPKLHDSLKKEMKEFFNGKLSEILVQWKAKFQNRLDHLSEILMSHAEDFCNGLLSSREAVAAFETDKQKYTGIIKGNVQQHIGSIKREQENLNSSLEKRKLTKKQLKQLLGRNLFTLENLKKYEEQDVITPDQKKRINDITQESGGQLTESTLNEVLVGGVLAVEEVKTILKMMKQTERELKAKFEDIWSELTKALPILSKPSVSVATEVQIAVKEFARAKTYYTTYIAKLREKGLSKWNQLDLIPEEELHYNKAIGFLKKLSHRLHRTDPCKNEATKVTQRVLNEVYVYLQDKTKRDTDFNPSFTTELLRIVDKEITESEQSTRVKELLTFTPDYRIEMYLIACGYALPMFEGMAELFKKRNDPLIYLEDHEKEPLFSKFKDQYYQTEAEEAIANTLCAYLKEPIKEQIGKSLCLKMVTKMKDSEKHFFSSKRALKVKVLTDLHEEGRFGSYMVYVRNVERCLKEHIEWYTVNYCDEKVSGGSTRMQHTAKNEVTHLVGVVENVVTEVGKRNAHKWLSIFCKHKKLRSELGVNLEPKDMLSGHDSSQELDLDNFRLQIRIGLDKLKKMLHESYDNITCETAMVDWKDKPHELLSDLVGCTKQCPFCGEQCDLLDEHEGKHRTEVHRPDCLAGWRIRETKVMTTNFCPVLVSDSNMRFNKSHDSDDLYYYNKYEEVYPDWSITPDKTAVNSLYWKWFVAEYSDEIGKEFNAIPPPVPSLWSTYMHKWHEVEEDLKGVYKL